MPRLPHLARQTAAFFNVVDMDVDVRYTEEVLYVLVKDYIVVSKEKLIEIM